MLSKYHWGPPLVALIDFQTKWACLEYAFYQCINFIPSHCSNVFTICKT